MPVMTPADVMRFLDDHFPQAADQGLAIEHLDDTTIRVRLPADERHLRPGGTISGPALMWLTDLSFYLLLLGRLGPVAQAVTTNLNINFMRKPEPADLIGEGRLMKTRPLAGRRRLHDLERGQGGAGGARHPDLFAPTVIGG